MKSFWDFKNKYLIEKIIKPLKSTRHVERYFEQPGESDKDVRARLGQIDSEYNQNADNNDHLIGRGLSLRKKDIPKLKKRLGKKQSIESIFAQSAFVQKPQKVKKPAAPKIKVKRKTTGQQQTQKPDKPLTNPDIKLIPTETPAQQVVGEKGKPEWRKEFHYLSGKKISQVVLPLNQVGLSETRETGRHNDEHALRKIWNHFSDEGELDEKQQPTRLVADDGTLLFDRKGKPIKTKKAGRTHRSRILELIEKKREELQKNRIDGSQVSDSEATEAAHDDIKNYVYDQIRSAKTNSEHELNILNAEPEEFKNKVTGYDSRTGRADPQFSDAVRARALSTHNQNLRDAALSFARLLQDPEYYDAFKNDFEMTTTGRKYGKLNEEALAAGLKENSGSAIYKSDLTNVLRKRRHNIEQAKKDLSLNEERNGTIIAKPDEGEEESGNLSVKKEGGSQAESPGHVGASLLYGKSLSKFFESLQNKNNIDPEKKEKTRAAATSLLSEILGHMKIGKKKKGNFDVGNVKLKKLHDMLDGLTPKEKLFSQIFWTTAFKGDHRLEPEKAKGGGHGLGEKVLVQGHSAAEGSNKEDIKAVLKPTEDYVKEDIDWSDPKSYIPTMGPSKHPADEGEKDDSTLRLRIKTKKKTKAKSKGKSKTIKEEVQLIDFMTYMQQKSRR